MQSKLSQLPGSHSSTHGDDYYIMNRIRLNDQDPVSKELLDKVPHPSMQNYYKHVAEFSTMDVYNGYYIETLEKTLTPSKDMATQISGGAFAGGVHMFGGDGGGGKFVVRTSGEGQILYLADYGAVFDSVYDGDFAPVWLVADNFNHFLTRLLRDVEAYIENRLGWKFITDVYR